MAATVTLTVHQRRGLAVPFLHNRGLMDIGEGTWVPLELIEPPLLYERPRTSIPKRLRQPATVVEPHCIFGMTCKRLIALTGMSMHDLKLSHVLETVTLVRPAVLSQLLPTRVNLRNKDGVAWWKDGGVGTRLHFTTAEEFAALDEDVSAPQLDLLVSIGAVGVRVLIPQPCCGRQLCVTRLNS